MEIKVENLNLSGIREYLENTYCLKKSGEKFSYTDVQGYIRRGNIPVYLGGDKIVPVANKYAKLYNIVKM